MAFFVSLEVLGSVASGGTGLLWSYGEVGIASVGIKPGACETGGRRQPPAPTLMGSVTREHSPGCQPLAVSRAGKGVRGGKINIPGSSSQISPR